MIFWPSGSTVETGPDPNPMSTKYFKTAAEVRAALEWGWTSYKREPWAREDGRRLYTFNMRSDVSTLEFQFCTLRFWAKRPMVAIKEILASGKDPLEFDGKTIN